MAKPTKNIIGAWAFLIGVILSIVAGIFGLLVGDSALLWTTILLILGIVIGLLNVGGVELKEFLIAGTVLVIVSALGGQALLALDYIGTILQALILLFVPATIVVALKVVFALAKR